MAGLCPERLRHYAALPAGTSQQEAVVRRNQIERRLFSASVRPLTTDVFADRERRTFVVMVSVAPKDGARVATALREAGLVLSRRSLGNVQCPAAVHGQPPSE